MGDSTVAGALVPSVPKQEQAPSGDASTAALAVAGEGEEDAGARASAGGNGEAAADRDLLCPICMAVIKDAFLTACGHSFCYMCIVTHLSHKSDCPCCGNYLTKAQLYPNFLLDKVCLFVLLTQPRWIMDWPWLPYSADRLGILDAYPNFKRRAL
jgi:E3 ubiquitin-protein ligase RFWD2